MLEETSTENSAKLPVRSTLQYWITLVVCKGRVLTNCIADTSRDVLVLCSSLFAHIGYHVQMSTASFFLLSSGLTMFFMSEKGVVNRTQ